MIVVIYVSISRYLNLYAHATQFSCDNVSSCSSVKFEWNMLPAYSIFTMKLNLVVAHFQLQYDVFDTLIILFPLQIINCEEQKFNW